MNTGLKQMEANFDSSKIWPQNILKSTHLYGIGLYPLPNRSVKRSKFHNPLFVFVVNALILIRCFVSLLLSDENEDINEDIYVMIGDFSHFIKAKFHFNIVMIFQF
jgi:hypothetical protein